VANVPVVRADVAAESSGRISFERYALSAETSRMSKPVATAEGLLAGHVPLPAGGAWPSGLTLNDAMKSMTSFGGVAWVVATSRPIVVW